MPISIIRGDIFDVNWTPSRGSEQAGIRPSLIIQNNIGNRATSYNATIVIAISSKLKGYPAMVLVDPDSQNGLTVRSEINTGQLMTIDKSRLIRRRGTLSRADMLAVEEKLAYILAL